MTSGQVINQTNDGEFFSAERAVISETAALLSDLSPLDPSMVTREELAEMVVTLASAAEAASVMAGRYMDHGENQAASLTKGERSMVALVSTGCRISRQRAIQLKRAGTIAHQYPYFHEAMMEGKLTTGHVDVFVAAAKLADSMTVAAAERSLTALAVLCTPEEFKAKLAEWVAAADPSEHLGRFLTEQANRHFQYGKDLFGNYHFEGTFEPVTGEQMINSIENRKTELVAQGGSKRSAGTVDALVDLVLGDKNGAANLEIICPDPHSDDFAAHEEDEFTPTVVPDGETVHDADPTDDDAEQADQYRCVEAESFLHWYGFMTGRRGNLCPPVPTIGDTGFGSIIYPRTAGGTLIPPKIAAQLARKGRIRRHMIDTDGNLAGDQLGGRRFSAAQKRMIRLRDNHCQHPGCRTRPRHCDYDHTKPHGTGGPTLTANGQALCEFHHRWKHRNDPGPNPPTIFDDSPVKLE